MADIDAVKLHKPALYRLIWITSADAPYICDDCPFYRMKTSRSAYGDPESGECALLSGAEVHPGSPQCGISDWRGQAATEAKESVSAAEYLDRRARSLQSEIIAKIVSAAQSGDKTIDLEYVVDQMELNPGISEALSRVLGERT